MQVTDKKCEANRWNARKSTGPKTLEGKQAVSLNAMVHGMRARHAVLLIEHPEEFRSLAAELYEEWQPRSSTEIHLVEQMAVCRWRMGRMEAINSSACLQSTICHLAYKDPEKYRTRKNTFSFPNAFDHVDEVTTQRMLNLFSLQQTRLERSYYTALEALQRLQELREKKESEMATRPKVETPEEAAAEEKPEKPKVMVAAATQGKSENQ
jgi:hypothetical protein